jgi:hypothetical protein
MARLLRVSQASMGSCRAVSDMSNIEALSGRSMTAPHMRPMRGDLAGQPLRAP